MKYPYRVWAEIDIPALTRNIGVIRDQLAPGTGIVLVTKANAYGHGVIPVATAAAASGVNMLGVGDSHEALEILEAGISLPILILGTIIDEELGTVARNGIHLGVHSSSRLDWLSDQALRTRRRLRVHLNIDTGMGRLGIPPEKAPLVASKVLELPGLELQGIYSHFAHSQFPPNPATRNQESAFRAVVLTLRRAGLLPRTALVHAANSATIFSGVGTEWDAVRPGLAAYGYLPPGIPGEEELTPVLSLKSQIIFYKDVPAGTHIGYQGDWVAKKPTRIATVSAGYNDGIPWRLGRNGLGRAMIHGQPAPYAGQVSMDYLCLDIGRIPGAQVGDPVTLIGRDGEGSITVTEMARATETTPYEILCNMGKRVRRVPVGNTAHRQLDPNAFGVDRHRTPNPH